MPSPAHPPGAGNPALIFCDSDALIQIFIVGATNLLQALKVDFGIEPVIMPEVEMELRWTKRFSNYFEQPLRKAVSARRLAICDQALLQSHFGPTGPPAFSAIQSLGATYHKKVGRGEAYTLAAATTLAVPALSNDFQAIKVLQAAKFALPEPVLRFFDLVAFGEQAGLLTGSDCDNIRRILADGQEHIPRAFRHNSFASGVQSFAPRLCVDQAATANVSTAHPGHEYKRKLLIARTT